MHRPFNSRGDCRYHPRICPSLKDSLDQYVRKIMDINWKTSIEMSGLQTFSSKKCQYQRQYLIYFESLIDVGIMRIVGGVNSNPPDIRNF